MVLRRIFEVHVSKLLLMLLLAACITLTAPAATVQSQTADEPPSPDRTPGLGVERPGQRDVPSETERKMEYDRAKKLNQERQADLKHDTDKLLLLATQLKQAVDKSNENTLSLEVIKKAGEIEKLAKSVREKMRGHN
jgi:hypothetical protein